MTPTIDQSVDPSNPATKLPGKPHRQDDVNIIIRDLQARLAKLENFIGQAPTSGTGLIHSGDTAGGDLAGTYPSPSLASATNARFALASSPQPKIGRPYKVYRAGAAYNLAAGWQGIAFDTMDFDGSNAEGMWTGVWTAPVTGFYFYQVHVLIQNATGGTIEMALGYNSSGRYDRQAVDNTFYFGDTYSETFYIGAGGTVQPTIWVSAVGGFGVPLSVTWTSFQRVG